MFAHKIHNSGDKNMFVFYFLYLAISIILLVVLSHMLLTIHLKTYDDKVTGYIKMWHRTLLRCHEKQDYRLKKREINRLKHPQKLAAFYEIYSQSPQEEFLQLITHNKTQILSVAKKYKSNTMKAYFAYLLSTFPVQGSSPVSDFDDLMSDYVLSDSVYVRENALKALYKFGDAERIAEAFEALSRKYIYHSEKLLTDGLLDFRGDFDVLSTLLMKHFGRYMECYQLAVVNCFAYKNEHKYDETLISYLKQDYISVDIKCSILRIIGKVPCEENKKILLFLLRKYRNSDDWAQAAVAANMLEQYEGDEQVIDALYEAISSPNWYVRMNCAKSLMEIGEYDEHINYIATGKDNYAANALAYAMRLRKEPTT